MKNQSKFKKFISISLFLTTIFSIIFLIFSVFADGIGNDHSDIAFNNFSVRQELGKAVNSGEITVEEYNQKIAENNKENNIVYKQPDGTMNDEALLSDPRFGLIRMFINDICNANTSDEGGGILNTQSLIQQTFSDARGAIESISGGALYHCFLGIGMFILIFSFCFSIYERNTITDKMTLEQMLKLMFKFIISLFIILNCKTFLSFILQLASSVLGNSLSGSGSSANNVNVANSVFLTLIRTAGLDKNGILDKITGAIAQIGLIVPLFLPWLLTYVAKFGVIMAILKCAIELVVYTVPYPMAAGDCYDNIKNSRFMSYSRVVFGAALQMAVIALILYASDKLLVNIMGSVLQMLSGEQNMSKIFSILFMLTAIQLSKMAVVMSSASTIANRAVGA